MTRFFRQRTVKTIPSLLYDAKNDRDTSGDAAGLAHLNEEAVYSYRIALSYDTISLGNSRFLFAPRVNKLCQRCEMMEAVRSRPRVAVF